MSLALRKDLYRAYCNLCVYTNQKPMRKSKWEKQFNKPVDHNRTVADIMKEIDAVRKFA